MYVNIVKYIALLMTLCAIWLGCEGCQESAIHHQTSLCEAAVVLKVKILARDEDCSSNVYYFVQVKKIYKDTSTKRVIKGKFLALVSFLCGPGTYHFDDGDEFIASVLEDDENNHLVLNNLIRNPTKDFIRRVRKIIDNCNCKVYSCRNDSLSEQECKSDLCFGEKCEFDQICTFIDPVPHYDEAPKSYLVVKRWQCLSENAVCQQNSSGQCEWKYKKKVYPACDADYELPTNYY